MGAAELSGRAGRPGAWAAVATLWYRTAHGCAIGLDASAALGRLCTVCSGNAMPCIRASISSSLKAVSSVRFPLGVPVKSDGLQSISGRVLSISTVSRTVCARNIGAVQLSWCLTYASEFALARGRRFGLDGAGPTARPSPNVLGRSWFPRMRNAKNLVQQPGPRQLAEKGAIWSRGQYREEQSPQGVKTLRPPRPRLVAPARSASSFPVQCPAIGPPVPAMFPAAIA